MSAVEEEAFVSQVIAAIKAENLKQLSSDIKVEKEQLREEVDALFGRNALNFITAYEQVLGCKYQLDEFVADVEESHARLKQQTTQIYALKKEKEFLDAVCSRVANGESVIARLNDVFALAKRAEDEANNKNYFSCIKTLQEIKTQTSDGKLGGMRIVGAISSWWGGMRARVRSNAQTDFEHWLLDASTRASADVGEAALSFTQDAMRVFSALPVAARKRISLFANNALEWIVRDDASESVVDVTARRIDLVPLFRSVAVFALLGERERLVAACSKSRNDRIGEILDAMETLAASEGQTSATFSASLHQLLADVCGFFIVEFFVCSSPQRIYSKSHVENRWSLFVGRFIGFVKTVAQSSATTTIEGCVMVKDALSVFVKTLCAFEYRFEQSALLFNDLVFRFLDFKKAALSQQISEILGDADVRDLLFVPDAAAFNELPFLRRIPLRVLDGPQSLLLQKTTPSSANTATVSVRSAVSLNEQALSYPVRLPFSAPVKDCFEMLVSFVDEYHIFLEGVPQENIELEELSRKSVEKIVSEVVAEAFVRKSNACADNIDALIAVWHSLHALSNYVFAELLAHLASKRLASRTASFDFGGAASSRLLQDKMAAVQLKIIAHFEGKLNDLLPIDSSNDDFIIYLTSIYKNKLMDFPADYKSLIFWNILNSAHNHLLQSFYMYSTRRPFEGPESVTFLNFKNILVLIEQHLINVFPAEEDYLSIFNGLAQVLTCIENLAFVDLTMVQSRREKFNLIDIPRFMAMLENLRTSKWASATKVSDGRTSVKAHIDDVLKRLRVEFKPYSYK